MVKTMKKSVLGIGLMLFCIYCIWGTAFEVKATEVDSMPPKVTNIKQTDCTTTGMTITWTSAEGANAYLVVWRLASEGNADYTDSKLVYTNTVKLTGLEKNEMYCVGVYSIYIPAGEEFTIPDNTGDYYIDDYYNGAYADDFLEVKPSKPSNVQVSTAHHMTGKMTVNCEYMSCADGYEAEVWTAYKSKDKKIASAKSVLTKKAGTSTCIIKKRAIKTNDFLKVRARAYTKLSSGKKKYGAWSDWEYTSGLCKFDMSNTDWFMIKKTGNRIGWKAIKGADRYTVYASTKAKSGYKKIGTTKKPYILVKKVNKKSLKPKKIYYFRVVPYHKAGGKYHKGLKSVFGCKWGW